MARAVGELAAQLYIGRGALGMNLDGRRLRHDRPLRIVALPLRSDLELGAKLRIVIAMVRRGSAQCANREVERVEREIAGKDLGRRRSAADEVRDFYGQAWPNELGALDVDDHQAGHVPACP
jgi:hypothetical protein